MVTFFLGFADGVPMGECELFLTWLCDRVLRGRTRRLIATAELDLLDCITAFMAV